jgi:hypothetical protein
VSGTYTNLVPILSNKSVKAAKTAIKVDADAKMEDVEDVPGPMDTIVTQPFQKKEQFSNLDDLATIDTCPNTGIYAKIDSAKFGAYMALTLRTLLPAMETLPPTLPPPAMSSIPQRSPPKSATQSSSGRLLSKPHSPKTKSATSHGKNIQLLTL